MRPGAGPQRALRRLADERLGEGADIAIERRSVARLRFIRRRQLDEEPAAIDQPLQRFEGGMIDRHGIVEAADMVDDDRPGQALEDRLAVGELAAVELDLAMPAELLNAGRQRLAAVPA